MNSTSLDEVRELADRHATGLLTEEQATRLSDLLRDDAEAQRAFLEVTSVYARLHWEFGGSQNPSPYPPVAPAVVDAAPPSLTLRASKRHGTNPRRGLAISLAASVLMLASLAGVAINRKEVVTAVAPPLPMAAAVATLKNVVNARWMLGAAPLGRSLNAGRLRLVQGLAEIEFACGAMAVLRAPAEIELVGAAEAFLHAGQVLVRVPKDGKATGFRVETPTSQLLDLGTEFGVEVDRGGSSVLQVYEGEVLASAKAEAATKSPHRVLEGEAVRLDRSLQTTPFWPERFVRLLPGPNDPTGRGYQPYNHSRYDSIDIIPAPASVAIDGDLSDWNQAGRLRSACEPPYAENYYLDAALMYDDEALYVGAHVGDPQPMRSQMSPSEPIDRHGMGGCVALRISTDRQAGWPLQAESAGPRRGRPASLADLSDKLSFVVMWYCQPEDKACVSLRHGMDLHGATTNPDGYAGEFCKDADGHGYTLEYKLPWRLLGAESDPPRGGDELAAMLLAHWSDAEGRRWQGQLIDVMKPNEPGWNFERAATWGKARYLKSAQ